MTNKNYTSPRSGVVGGSRAGLGEYASYDQVPIYRRQWFFWITYFLLSPVALAILVFGDVYYVKNGRVVGFGLANRLVAGVFSVYMIYSISNGIS